MNIESITLATQTMFAEPQQRCLDAEFDELYDERGTWWIFLPSTGARMTIKTNRRK